MNIPESDFEIRLLSDEFYKMYQSPPFDEILKKNNRPYNCILFQTHYDYYICVPYRSEITHSYAFHFKKSSRSRKHKSGLDYSKIVIINKDCYIGNKQAILDKDEYNETIKNIRRIKQEALTFVEAYIAHLNGTHLLDSQEFNRRYTYSTLKYFHSELGI